MDTAGWTGGQSTRGAGQEGKRKKKRVEFCHMNDHRKPSQWWEDTGYKAPLLSEKGGKAAK